MLFNTKIKLIETTHLLTRIPVDTMTFTKPLYHDYLPYAEPVTEYEKKYENLLINRKTYANFDMPTVYQSIYAKSYVPIYAFAWTENVAPLNSNQVVRETTIRVRVNDKFLDKEYKTTYTNGKFRIDNLKLKESGTVEIWYEAQVWQYDNLNLADPENRAIAIAIVSFNVIANTSPKPDRTLADVVDRVLNAGLGNQSGKYHLDDASRERLKKYIAPEFKFTRNNLYEVLVQVGGYSDVQGIPRLKSGADGKLNVIKYDFLSNEEWQPKDENGEDLKPIAMSYESTIDDWCGGFETYAENLIDNSPSGSVRQPCLQTVRVATGELEIDDNHAVIPTPSPIYTVQSVEMGYIQDGVFVGEIKPYIFESSEYNNLTGYKGEFPFAKQFALCYTQGQRNITALTLKPETATSLGYSLTEMSAIQIAEKVTGRNVPSSTGLCKLAYRVTYTPIQTARLRQYRPYKDNHSTDNVMFYNQAGNSLDINNYGSNVKNNLIQTGNKVEFLTFRLTRLSQRPKVGQKYKGKYISSADYEYERYWIKVTITLTENYNRKSQYVVLDSRQRFYEVSERNVENRMCNYSFEVQVGDSVSASNTEKILTDYIVKNGGVSCLTPYSNNAGKTNESRLSYAIAEAKNEEGENINNVKTLHELNVNAFGNSVVFSFAYEDNYSAGNQAIYNATKGVNVSSDRKLQRAVQYGDEYGEFDSLNMKFFSDSNGIVTNFADQVSTADKQAFCDALPNLIDTSRLPSITSAQYERKMMKDGGERISVTTQLHFRANRDNVVIGSALAKNSYLVVDKIPQIRAVLLKKEIEKWQEQININDKDNVIDILENTNLGRIDVDSDSIGGIQITFTIVQGEYKAVALVTENGELLVGENGNYTVESQPQSISINYLQTKPI